ncbi:unnamed protein product, partial [Iphiclides podalirius]
MALLLVPHPHYPSTGEGERERERDSRKLGGGLNRAEDSNKRLVMIEQYPLRVSKCFLPPIVVYCVCNVAKWASIIGLIIEWRWRQTNRSVRRVTSDVAFFCAALSCRAVGAPMSRCNREETTLIVIH